MPCRYAFNSEAYNVHRMTLDIIVPNSKVLDLGCAGGYLAKELKKKRCQVWGVDKDKESLKKVKEHCRQSLFLDLENIKNTTDIPNNYFDHILILDTVEHLRNSQVVLSNLKRFLKKSGKIIISLPNIAILKMRLSLLFGRFEYEDTGILDKSHLMFFTRESIKKLAERSSLITEAVYHNADLGILPIIGRALKKLPRKAQCLTTKIRPALLAAQFIFICSTK